MKVIEIGDKDFSCHKSILAKACIIDNEELEVRGKMVDDVNEYYFCRVFRPNDYFQCTIQIKIEEMRELVEIEKSVGKERWKYLTLRDIDKLKQASDA